MPAKIDLTGRRFGRLSVIREQARSKGGQLTWACRCDCGGSSVVTGANLRSGHTTSCGCFMRQVAATVNAAPARPAQLARDGSVALIPLTKGKFAVVDPDDAQSLSAFLWHATPHGYAARREPRRDGNRDKLIYMHRQIMRAQPGQEVDHRNHDGLDNRRFNLRLTTHQGNLCNRKGAQRNSTTGVLGVSLTRAGKYTARLSFSGKEVHLGVYETLEEAARVASEERSRRHETLEEMAKED